MLQRPISELINSDDRAICRLRRVLYDGQELEWFVPFAEGDLDPGERRQGLLPSVVPHWNIVEQVNQSINHSISGLQGATYDRLKKLGL